MMDHYTLVQDFVVLLLAAGLAGVLCKRIGLSAIVGYLLAGIVIGPYSPPFSLIEDTDHIAQLSHVGLVFLMFAIGLELSLSKLRRMGLPIIMATTIGALFMFAFTILLGRLLSGLLRRRSTPFPSTASSTRLRRVHLPGDCPCPPRSTHA